MTSIWVYLNGTVKKCVNRVESGFLEHSKSDADLIGTLLF